MKVLVDSDAFFALFVVADPSHLRAKEIYERLVKEHTEFFVSNFVITESATVLSHKVNQKAALDFLEKFPDLGFNIVLVDSKVEKEAWKIFKIQTKNKTSFIDCSNAALLPMYKLDKFFAFDEFYPKELRVV